MAAGPAPAVSPLMDKYTFTENFGVKMPNKTYLCYEVEQPEGDSRIPAELLKGVLRNQSGLKASERRHAELRFLDLIRSWGLDREQRYSITLFISWSPCYDCALSLATFLRGNRLVSLRIFAARIYSKDMRYKFGLPQLKAAGAQVSTMGFPEYQHCWGTFVDHQGQDFLPEVNMVEHIQKQSKELEHILQGN